MKRSILVLNAGSSSLKFAVHARQPDGRLAMQVDGQIADLYGTPRFEARDAGGAALGEKSPRTAQTHHEQEQRTAQTHQEQPQSVEELGGNDPLEWLLGWLGAHAHAYDAVGHRVVHGGMHYAEAVRVDAAVLAALESLVALAPLHQPHNLAPIQRLAALQPDLPQVACFDTAFHRTNSELVQRYALPDALHQRGIRRYGFHGLSYTYIAAALSKFDARAAAGKCIVLHLGNGASLCALDGGVSVASSMGFSALDGIPMSTRSGALDPGVLLHLMRTEGMDAAALEKLLYRESGLLGISGVSGDMRALSSSANPDAALAIDVFVYRIVREIGSLMAALGGLDALVFTAGIGENAANIRARVIDGLHWLGARIDPLANARHGPCITSVDSQIIAWVIPTDEEGIIARQTLAVLDALIANRIE